MTFSVMGLPKKLTPSSSARLRDEACTFAVSIADFAEFLETYGLPIVVGRYYAGASADEKATLLRAVTALGHDARAIMPQDMQLEIQKVTADGSGTPHLAMVDWAERSESKAILGQVLSAEAKSTGLGSGVADVHNEVRHDIRDADARQIAGTVTRDLLYPLLALNRGASALSRCPRLVFDTGEAEDITAYADALPKLVNAGLRSIPVAWVHDKLGIPVPAEGEETLGAPAGPTPPPAGKAALAALSGGATAPENGAWADLAVDRLAKAAAPSMADWIASIQAMLDSASSLDEFRGMLLAAFPMLPTDAVADAVAMARLAGHLAGRVDVAAETDHAAQDHPR